MEVKDFKNNMFYYSRKTSEKISKIFGPIGEQYGFTMLQLIILMELNKGESHTIGSLASSVCVQETNLSVMCKKLESRELISRVRDRDDERVVKIQLTETGRKVVQEIDRELNEKFYKHIDNQQQENFQKIIYRLQDLNILLDDIIAQNG